MLYRIASCTSTPLCRTLCHLCLRAYIRSIPSSHIHEFIHPISHTFASDVFFDYAYRTRALYASRSLPVNADRANRKRSQTRVNISAPRVRWLNDGHMVGCPPRSSNLCGVYRGASVWRATCASQINLLALTLPVFIVFTHHVRHGSMLPICTTI